MMTREKLEDALHTFDTWTRPTALALRTVAEAARKQLALMAEKCDEPGCQDGVWFIQGSIRNGEPCIACHGSGKCYPQETVETIAAVFSHISVTPKIWAVAVLDALGETE